MTIPIAIIGDSEVRLWHLSNRERLRRQIAQAPTLQLVESLPGNTGHPQISVSAEFLFDPTTLSELAKHQEALLIDPASQRVAAVVSSLLDGAHQRSLLNQTATANSTQRHLSPEDLAVYDSKLRRHTAPTLAQLETAQRPALEAKLYGAAYKGITDLVTKWWWPRPAKQGVRFCAAYGITPNQVTLFGATLMLLALWLFYSGHFAAGLAAGWLMTYLDTVDGKLARVTVQSSEFGHLLDHGMDILHPPFWYIAWAAGLSASAPVFQIISFQQLALLIFGGYIAGRLIEGAFHLLGECSLFAWRPFDAYFRLITGRRNPNLILLTLGWGLGRPDLGLYWVAVWTALSTGILLLRFGYGGWVRLQSGPLQSWLVDGAAAAARYPRAYRTFASTRAAYRASGNDA